MAFILHVVFLSKLYEIKKKYSINYIKMWCCLLFLQEKSWYREFIRINLKSLGKIPSSLKTQYKDYSVTKSKLLCFYIYISLEIISKFFWFFDHFIFPRKSNVRSFYHQKRKNMPPTQYKIYYALMGVGPELELVIQRFLFLFF